MAEIGFGKAAEGHEAERLLNRDGRFNVEKQGLSSFRSLSVYNALLTTSWPKFFGLVACVYLVSNFFFAAIFYLAGPGAIGGGDTADIHHRLLRCFFFSVETLATIGYGSMYPVGIVSNVIMTLESLTGLMEIALVTGLLFARFSRPQAKVAFSEKALIAPYRGARSFQFRMINERRSELFEPRVRVVYTDVKSEGGRPTRQYYQLPLLFEQVMFFPLYWTITHVIDAKSPLAGITPKDLEDRKAEFLILLTASDETFSETVYVRASYRYDEIIFGASFEGMYIDSDSGRPAIDVAKLSSYQPADLPQVVNS